MNDAKAAKANRKVIAKLLAAHKCCMRGVGSPRGLPTPSPSLKGKPPLHAPLLPIHRGYATTLTYGPSGASTIEMMTAVCLSHLSRHLGPSPVGRIATVSWYKDLPTSCNSLCAYVWCWYRKHKSACMPHFVQVQSSEFARVATCTWLFADQKLMLVCMISHQGASPSSQRRSGSGQH